MLYPSHERYGGFTTRENNTGLGRSSRPERLHKDLPFFLTRIHSIRHGSNHRFLCATYTYTGSCFNRP